MSFQKRRTAIEIGHLPAGLLHHQRRRREIPAADERLQPGIVTSGSHITERQSRRTVHTDGRHPAIQPVDEVLARAGIAFGIVRQLHHQVGLVERRYVGNVHPHAVHVGATALPGIETLVAHRLVDHSQQQFVAAPQGNAHTVGRHVVDVVRGAVQRVDHPAIPFTLPAGRAFLGDEPRLRQQLPQRFHHPPLRLAVDVGHIVVGTLGLHGVPAEILPFFLQKMSGFACHPAHVRDQ